MCYNFLFVEQPPKNAIKLFVISNTHDRPFYPSLIRKFIDYKITSTGRLVYRVENIFCGKSRF